MPHLEQEATKPRTCFEAPTPLSARVTVQECTFSSRWSCNTSGKEGIVLERSGVEQGTTAADVACCLGRKGNCSHLGETDQADGAHAGLKTHPDITSKLPPHPSGLLAALMATHPILGTAWHTAVPSRTRCPSRATSWPHPRHSAWGWPCSLTYSKGIFWPAISKCLGLCVYYRESQSWLSSRFSFLFWWMCI